MKGISLSSVIQVINLERQSCDIEAQALGQMGQLHFRDGALVDAIADDLAGEDAAYEILAWPDPEFEVSTQDAPRDRTIDADLTHLLLETARRQDEGGAGIEPSASDDGSHNAPDPLGDLASTPDRIPPSAATAAPALELVTSAAPADPPPPAGPVPLAHPAPPLSGAQAPARAMPVMEEAPAPVAAAGAGALSAASLRRVVEIASDGLGDALLSADVYSSADGTSYAGVNSKAAGCALINQITERMMWSLGKSDLPPLGRYYMVDLADAKILLVAPCGAIQLNLIVDTARVQLGLLLNVILPEVLSALKDASPA